MDQIKRTELTWLWWLFGILAIAALASHYVRGHIEISPAEKQQGLSKANILLLYTTIRQMEEVRGKMLASIVKEQCESNNIGSVQITNINWFVYKLIKEDHLANLALLPSTNIDGLDEFIDVWGRPYNIGLVPNMGTNYGEIEHRVRISLIVN